MRAAWTRLDTGVGLALAALGFATRALHRVSGFHSLDAGLLALGATGYEFNSYRPHPPYYPLTVAAARLLTPWFEPLDALSWLSVAASAGLVAGTFVVARGLAGRWTAVAAALMVLASPVALRNGIAPLSYSLEGLSSVAVAWVAWQARRRGGAAWAVALGCVASIGVGIRPSALVLLAPLALWATWGRWRDLAWGLAAGVAATLAWLLPTVWAGGGWQAFRYGLDFQSRLYILADPVWKGGWPAVETHAAWLAFHLRHSLPFALALGAALAVAGFSVLRLWPRGNAPFLAAWLLPGLAFYVLVYGGWPVYPDGYLMALIPPLTVAAAIALQTLLAVVGAPGVARPLQVVGVACVAALAAQPVAWVGEWDEAIREARAAQAWDASWAGLDEAFPPESTAFIAFYAAPWVQLRHPDHLAWFVEVYQGTDGVLHVQVEQWQAGRSDKTYFANIQDGPDDAPHPIPDWVERVVVVDGHPLEVPVPLTAQGLALNQTRLAGGRVVSWFSPDGLANIEAAASWMQFEPQAPSLRVQPPW